MGKKNLKKIYLKNFLKKINHQRGKGERKTNLLPISCIRQSNTGRGGKKTTKQPKENIGIKFS